MWARPGCPPSAHSAQTVPTGPTGPRGACGSPSEAESNPHGGALQDVSEDLVSATAGKFGSLAGEAAETREGSLVQTTSLSCDYRRGLQAKQTRWPLTRTQVSSRGSALETQNYGVSGSPCRTHMGHGSSRQHPGRRALGCFRPSLIICFRREGMESRRDFTAAQGQCPPKPGQTACTRGHTKFTHRSPFPAHAGLCWSIKTFSQLPGSWVSYQCAGSLWKHT